MVAASKRVTFVCGMCGGKTVTRDAWAEWDVEAQEWLLGDAFDYAYCHDCDAETNLIEVELAPRATPIKIVIETRSVPTEPHSRQ
jgi:hypothetical protein